MRIHLVVCAYYRAWRPGVGVSTIGLLPDRPGKLAYRAHKMENNGKRTHPDSRTLAASTSAPPPPPALSSLLATSLSPSCSLCCMCVSRCVWVCLQASQSAILPSALKDVYSRVQRHPNILYDDTRTRVSSLTLIWDVSCG